jgi:hypothetical protein
MLSKNICEKCIKQWCHEIAPEGISKYELENREDGELDNLDITWKYHHRVECPRLGGSFEWIGIYTDAPDECPYQLEHLLETQPPPFKDSVRSFFKKLWHIFLCFVGVSY